MATETGRNKWSDERLDDLNANVREGFARTGRTIYELRTEVHDGFVRVDDALARIDKRFDALQRALIVGLLGVTGTLIASIAAIVIALG